MSIKHLDSSTIKSMHNRSPNASLECIQIDNAADNQPSGTAKQRYSHQRYICYFLFGLAYMSAWNVFISIPGYFRSKLNGSAFVETFQNYFSVVYMLTMLTSITLLVYLLANIPVVKRIHVGFILLNVAFATTLALSFVPYINPTLFFGLVLMLVALAAVASSLMSSLYSYAASYNPIYTQSFSIGQGLGGTLPSLYSLVLIAMSRYTEAVEGSSEGPAYFTVAVLISTSCYWIYWRVFVDDKEFDRGSIDQAQSLLVAGLDVIDEGDAVKLIVSTNKINRLAIGGCVNSLITLALFPAITSAIEATSDDLSYYLVAIHFLVFNIGDLVGKAMPGLPQFYIKQEKTLLSAIYARFTFIVLFLLCNVVVRTPLGLVMPSAFPLIFGDLAYLLILLAFAVTNGWLGTNVFMLAPSYYPNAVERVGDVLVFGMVVGLTIGSICSFAIRSVFCQCNPFS